jgi:hypothetical protein
LARSPFDRVSESAQPALLLILTILVIGLVVRLSLFDRALTTPEAPLGIVSYELAGSAERAAAILDSWSQAGRSAAMFVQGLDAFFLVAYTSWLSLACVRLGGRLSGSWRRACFATSWAVLLAAPLDALENFSLVQQLSHGPSNLHSQIAWLSAIPKFVLVASCGALLAAGSLVWIVRPGARR